MVLSAFAYVVVSPRRAKQRRTQVYMLWVLIYLAVPTSGGFPPSPAPSRLNVPDTVSDASLPVAAAVRPRASTFAASAIGLPLGSSLARALQPSSCWRRSRMRLTA